MEVILLKIDYLFLLYVIGKTLLLNLEKTFLVNCETLDDIFGDALSLTLKVITFTSEEK